MTNEATLKMLSENEVINESENIYEEKGNDVLRDLQVEMKLRGLSKQKKKNNHRKTIQKLNKMGEISYGFNSANMAI